MAVRQYVGARYVPKFADPVAWQSGTSYEALTIVTYNNSSYTSKVPVPATVGNPADNSDYWALTGNYNAQVEAYREETVAVQENLNEEINKREQADTALGERITNEITARQNADTAITDSLKTFAVYLGNSYTFGQGSDTSRGLFERTKDLFDGAKSYTASSIGLVAYDTVTNTFETMLDNAIDDSSLDKNAVTHLIIIGAWGDSRGWVKSNRDFAGFIGTVESKLIAIREKAQNAFPNLKRMCYAWAEARAFYNQTLFDINNTFYDEYMVNTIMAIACPYAHFDYLGWIGFNITEQTGFFSSDNYHPNDAGYAELAGTFKAAFRGNTVLRTRQLLVQKEFDNEFLSGKISVTYAINWNCDAMTVTILDIEATGTENYNISNSVVYNIPLFAKSADDTDSLIPAIKPSAGELITRVPITLMGEITYMNLYLYSGPAECGISISFYVPSGTYTEAVVATGNKHIPINVCIPAGI